MSTEENKELIRRYFEEVWNRGNLALLEELHDPEYAEHSKRHVPMWRRTFPDEHVTIDTLVAEGNTVVVGFTTQGTHLGTLEGSLFPAWFPQPWLPSGKSNVEASFLLDRGGKNPERGSLGRPRLDHAAAAARLYAFAQ